MRLIARAGVAALLLGAVVGFAAPAQAAPVVVAGGPPHPQDPTRGAGGGPCSDTAIRFGASNITLDLNGKRVLGPSEGNCNCPGIHVLNRQNDRIINGTVTKFSTGIYLEGGSGHTISGVVARDNIGLLSGDTIFGEGIQLYQSNDNQILNSQLIHNGTFSGINLYDSANNLVQGNQVLQNNVAQSSGIMQDIGIWVISLSTAGLSSNNRILANSAYSNGLDGIQVSRFSGVAGVNTVTGNTASNNGFGQKAGIRDGDGIAVFGVNNLIENNTVTGNAAHGVGVRDRTSQPALANRLLRNRAYNNTAGPNPQANYDLFDGNANCGVNVWSGNQGTTFSPACTKNP
jgi:parallel beta-helix repeat protein